MQKTDNIYTKPLYQELADLKQFMELFQVRICRSKKQASWEYGLICSPWKARGNLKTFPTPITTPEPPMWYLRTPKPTPVLRETGPPNQISDKQLISMRLLQRIGFMETQALDDHLWKRHAMIPPLVKPVTLQNQEITNLFLTSRRVTSEWQAQLWAQRT